MAMPAEKNVSVRRGKKSAAAFRTISEVATELELPQHVLRFWETKFPSIKPLKRGGGRRYYRPEDVALLKHIRNLLYVEGYTIKGVQKLLNKNMPSFSAIDEVGELPKKLVAAVPLLVSEAGHAEASELDPKTREVLKGLLEELTELRAILRNSNS